MGPDVLHLESVKRKLHYSRRNSGYIKGKSSIQWNLLILRPSNWRTLLLSFNEIFKNRTDALVCFHWLKNKGFQKQLIRSDIYGHIQILWKTGISTFDIYLTIFIITFEIHWIPLIWHFTQTFLHETFANRNMLNIIQSQHNLIEFIHHLQYSC